MLIDNKWVKGLAPWEDEEIVLDSVLKSAVSIKLNAGVGPTTGNTLIKSCSLGNVVYAANPDKIMNIVGLALPVLSYPLNRVERTEVSTINN
ncbi:MAG: hypothetical protein LBD04_07250 [Synergistaceae bacterium]|nr:hypothetical protein [Synergistaceae bacterium]